MKTKTRGIRIEDLPERYQVQIRRQLAAVAPGRPPSQPEPDEGSALGGQGEDALMLVNPDCPLLVRIVRVGGRPMDDDNLAAGCKELRDAIAAALGRRGDSQADGLTWEYAQEPGEVGTRIELYAPPGIGSFGGSQG